MPEFYHHLITEKSFKMLQDLKRRFNFILIGGWAVFLYSQVLKSKDIDIILDYDELEKFKKEKDLIDIFSLIKEEKINWSTYQELVEKYHLQKINEDLKNIIASTRAIPELNLLNHQIARLKKKVLEEI